MTDRVAPVEVDVRATCSACGQRMVEVAIADVALALVAAARSGSGRGWGLVVDDVAKRMTRQHARCAKHVRCAACSPAWWCACIVYDRVAAPGKDPVDAG